MTIKNALVVDDSKSARMILQRLLEKMNVITQGVESGEEALRYLENKQPDIIFMDHMMPGMDGLEATKTIKNNPKTQSIPTIMYTSKEGEGYNSLAMSHGAMGVLPKPANQQAIMAVIDSLENTAANDVSATEKNNDTVSDVSLEVIEKIIQQRLNNLVLSAKAEISAGLDGLIHQGLQTQQERLTIAAKNLKQQIKPLQVQLSALDDDTALLQRLQPHLQKKMIVIADKVSCKKIDMLENQLRLKIQKIEERQDNILIEISNKSQTSMLQGLFGGALLGSVIAIAVSFII